MTVRTLLAARRVSPGSVPQVEGDESARVRLAARHGTPPAVLRALATDPSITVRAAVAMNPAFAPDADRCLLADEDDRIRTLLAGKLARLLPNLSAAASAAAQRHVRETLAALARDAAERVRAAIADALMDMPQAPRELILLLARDPAVTVSDPVIRFSPLLSDDDLLDLLATPAHPRTAQSVASRMGLGAAVAERIAAHADSDAVRTLLENPSAAIQEATLDALVGRADRHPEWHEPLVRRPTLPGRTVLALSRIVAGRLRAVLAARADVPAELAAAIGDHLDTALDTPAPASEADVLDAVRRLADAGGLNEAALLNAAAAGENRMLAAMLAVACGMPLAMLDRAVALRSAKALISLVWRAGFTMQLAAVVQAALGQLAPADRLPADQDGGFPLTTSEMEWQIELLAEPGR